LPLAAYQRRLLRRKRQSISFPSCLSGRIGFADFASFANCFSRINKNTQVAD
jgi:hypothetical protein